MKNFLKYRYLNTKFIFLVFFTICIIFNSIILNDVIGCSTVTNFETGTIIYYTPIIQTAEEALTAYNFSEDPCAFRNFTESSNIAKPPNVNSSKNITFKPEIGFPGFTGEYEINGQLLNLFMSKLIKYSIYLAGIVAVIMIILAGFQWLSAGGNQSKIGTSKGKITSAIIGLALIFCSYIILNTVNPSLTNLDKNLELLYIEPDYREDFDVVGYPDDWTEETSFLNFNENNANNTDKYNLLSIFTKYTSAESSIYCSSKYDSNCPISGIDANNAHGWQCTKEGIKTAAALTLGQVAGPCHCACYVTRTLRHAGCGNCITLNVERQKNEAIPKDYLKIEGNAARKRPPRAGDIITVDGHTMLSIGSYVYHVGEKKEYCVSWVIHSTPIVGTWNGCTKSSKYCENSWHGLGDKKPYRPFAGGKCTSNQVVKVTRLYYLSDEKYTLYVHPQNKAPLVNGAFAVHENCTTKVAEDKFISEYGDPNLKSNPINYINHPIPK